MTNPDRGGPEDAGSLDMVEHFGFRTTVELNLIPKVLFYHTVLKLWFSRKTIACNCDTRLLSS